MKSSGNVLENLYFSVTRLLLLEKILSFNHLKWASLTKQEVRKSLQGENSVRIHAEAVEPLGKCLGSIVCLPASPFPWHHPVFFPHPSKGFGKLISSLLPLQTSHSNLIYSDRLDVACVIKYKMIIKNILSCILDMLICVCRRTLATHSVRQ